MRNFFFVFVFVFALSITCFASNGEEDPRQDLDVNRVNSVYIVSSDTSISGLDISSVSVVKSVSPVTPSDSNGFKAILLNLLGDYDPVIVEYEYHNPNSQYVSYLREVQPDYPWLISAALFILVIYCLFRLGGAIFCRK